MNGTPTFRLELVVRALRRGGVVAYPTEGVWGLGCDPWDAAAVRALLALKGRPERKGLILVAGDVEQLRPLLRALPAGRIAEVLASWPGPRTWVVPAPPEVPALIRGDSTGIALRVSAHPVVRALCLAFGGPIVSTSANPSGRPAARSALAVRGYFRDRLDAVLPGALGGQRGPSEIRDALSGRILRAAAAVGPGDVLPPHETIGTSTGHAGGDAR